MITFSAHSEGQQYSWQVQASNVAGSGPWSDTLTFTYSTTDVEAETGTPKEYSIGQNYPNPFNPTTTITFALPQSGRTSITLYDLLGRKVKTLLNEELAAGVHEVRFDASSLPSAVYFYSFHSGSFVQTLKMVLLK
jgi:hypothetical protein